MKFKDDEGISDLRHDRYLRSKGYPTIAAVDAELEDYFFSGTPLIPSDFFKVKNPNLK